METGTNIVKNTSLRRYKYNNQSGLIRPDPSKNQKLTFAFTGSKPALGVELEFNTSVKIPRELLDTNEKSQHWNTRVALSTGIVTNILNDFGLERANASPWYDRTKVKDGYISNDDQYFGFEMRTIPMGLDLQREHWLRCLNGRIKNGLPLRDANGIHVHADAKFVPRIEQKAKIIYLLGTNPGFFKLFGRSSSWSEFPVYYVKNGVSGVQASISSGNLTNKSTACSVTYKGTLEFRFFPPTFEYTKMMAFIEIVDALMYYGAYDPVMPTLAEFLSFAAAQPNKYSNMLRRAGLVMKVQEKK